ncbi:MAG TPA: hypothetical protein VKR06_21085 [Ktedonosporobacter sp.]|nr:hypothetical protein [Ktedonosporobacter sp.]
MTGYANDAGYHTVMPYSGQPGFSYPFFLGLLSILFSFGKGLIFFVPGLLLPVRSVLLKMQQEKKLELYRAYGLWLCFIIGLILVYARWWSWYGGTFWGPRFFLIASIPASFAIALRLQNNREASLLTNLFTLFVFALSGWVGISGAVFTQSTDIPLCGNHNYALEAFCHYVPEFSVLWHPFVVHQYLDPHQIKYVLYCLVVLVYLATPLVVRIIHQLVEVANTYARPYLDFKTWRF